mgnify:FL=1
MKQFKFYLENENTHVDILLYQGTLEDFDKVIGYYEVLWELVIDKQLSLLGNGETIEDLTESRILLNWEGSNIIAYDGDNYFDYPSLEPVRFG